MPSQTLLALTGNAPQNGPITAFPQADNIRVFQINPRPGVAFSGAIEIEGSYAASPGNNDFQRIATVTFTNHTSNFSMDVESDAPWIRVRLTQATLGEIAVFGTSRSGVLTGGGGVSLNSASAVVNSPLKVGITGAGVHVAAPIQPAFSSDDVVYSLDISKTVTDKIDELEQTVGATTASVADLDILTGAANAGVTDSDIQKLACITVSCAEINNVSGVTSNLQVQLDGKAAGSGVDLTGWSTDVSWVNTFFDGAPTITVSALSAALTGLTASAADLNALTGTAGSFTSGDLTKLGNITASAAEINSLSGFTGTSTDLNKVVGLTTSVADINAITGLAGTGVTTTELAYLSGLTQNVEAGLNAATALVGLTASVGDLNLLSGAATGTGAYAAPISATEISYLDGLVGNIQSQLNNKRDVGTAIGISEISGAAITTTELNYLSGSTSNIQAQIDAIAAASIGVSGGTFTAPIFIADGSPLAPGLGYASANLSGLYLSGADGIGFAAGGARVGGFDKGTYNWHVGPGVDAPLGTGESAGAGGEPMMRGTGFNEMNPAYTFYGDDNTGWTWDSPDTMILVAGGERMVELSGSGGGSNTVTIGGPVATNNTLDVTAMGQERLLSKTTLDVGILAGPVADTTLYTVPVGRELLVTKVAFKLKTVNIGAYGGVTSVLRLNVGWLTPEFDELIDNVGSAPSFFNPSYGAGSFDTPPQVIWAGLGGNDWQAVAGSSGADYQMIAPGTAVVAHVDTLADFAVFELEILVFGYEQSA